MTWTTPAERKRIRAILRRVGRAAAEKAWAAGLPVCVLEHGKVVEIYAKGDRRGVLK